MNENKISPNRKKPYPEKNTGSKESHFSAWLNRKTNKKNDNKSLKEQKNQKNKYADVGEENNLDSHMADYTGYRSTNRPDEYSTADI